MLRLGSQLRRCVAATPASKSGIASKTCRALHSSSTATGQAQPEESASQRGNVGDLIAGNAVARNGVGRCFQAVVRQASVIPLAKAYIHYRVCRVPPG
jgi:hypothetical protein